ncbi:2-dehydro-3-deoxygalactonokinase [Planctomicrobium sp. SH661]|uniref:2-dehydro-3-deoxygalactonokinase n=1 Tax=Planctomicrobium sp. SH661 TaxID=3448124 RepID=UPI003F5B8358
MMRYFFSCDWGTTHFRLRLIDALDLTILAEERSEEGIAGLSSQVAKCGESIFRDVLDRHVNSLVTKIDQDLNGVPVVISGMASSSIGWRELPYAPLPFALDGSSMNFVRLDEETSRHSRPILLFSGCSSERDVMRGEETELIGLRALAPEVFAQSEEVWVLLPGTHSKHVRVRQETIVDFQTYLTGELFQLICRHSSLRNPHGEMKFTGLESPVDASRWQEPFLTGVDLAQQGELIGSLFQVRTGQLLRKENAMQSAAFLSGMLIGSELKSLALNRVQYGAILLAVSSGLDDPYRIAFDHLGLSAQTTIVPAAEVAKLSALGQLRALQCLLPE